MVIKRFLLCNFHLFHPVFAHTLGVTPEEVIDMANAENFVGLAMFKDDLRLKEVVDIFAEVGVSGKMMLLNCRFFEHPPMKIRKGIEDIKNLYSTNKFQIFHLNQASLSITM